MALKEDNFIVMTMFSGNVEIIVGRGDTHPFYITEGARKPDLLITLKDEDGAARNLAGATGTFTLTRKLDGSRIFDKQAMALVVAADGTIKYEWAAGNTDEPGSFMGEVIITISALEQVVFELLDVVIRQRLSTS